jgi:hypothetical protein
MVRGIVLALVYGIGASYASVQVALTDSVISGQEWSAIFGAFFVAAWGKWSHPDTVVSPNGPQT